MEPDNLTPLPPEPVTNPAAELQARYDSLQQLVGSVMILVLMVSGTLLAYLYWQVKNVNRELETARPQVANIVSQYQHGPSQAQDQFVERLKEFSRSHQDFVPILNKYPFLLGGTNRTAPTIPASVPLKK